MGGPAALNLLWFDFGDHYLDFLSEVTDIPFNMVLATGHESFFSELDSGLVDIEASIDVSDIPDLVEEARRRGIAIEPMGTSPAALLVMCDHPLASKEELTREDLRGQSLLMPDRGTYLHWRRSLMGLLGEDLDVNYVLFPVNANLSNLMYQDFDNMVYLTDRNTIQQIANMRSDVVVFDRLDGKEVALPLALFYRFDNDNPNLDLFIERARRHFDEAGAPKADEGRG